jgi:glycosyltransferase involved in cell wall biosynthesis
MASSPVTPRRDGESRTLTGLKGGRRLRIGIDGRNLKRFGTGFIRYTVELCKALDVVLPEAEFYVYSPFPLELPVKSDRWISRVDPWTLNGRIRGAFWLKTRLGSLLRNDRLDSFWGTVTFLPSLPDKVKRVVSVHDVVHLVAPETMSFRLNLPLYMFFSRDCRRADAILTNSQGTADRLLATLGCHTVGVVRPAASEDFRPRPAPEIASCLERYGIRAPYILGVGVSVRRKNTQALVEAFAAMKRAGELPDHSLVLAGPPLASNTRLEELIAANPTDINRIGYVEEKDLPALYCGASVFAFPSLYEGFGIPVLEARACGTRIVATDMPELREAGGDGPIYIAPTVAGVRDGILEALSRPAPRPLTASERPSWVESVQPLAHALASVD